jgi:transcriptional regulator with XRE-family HTH domain
MTQVSLARKLRLLRAERKLSLRQAAKLTGLAKETLSDLERGRRHPNDVTLAKIAEGYGISVEELFDLEDEPLGEPALAGKAEALPSPPEVSDEAEERRELYPWVSDVLANLIDTWEGQVKARYNSAQSRTIAIAALDVRDAVMLHYRDDEWTVLPAQERAQRKAFSEYLDGLAMRGLAHYRASTDAKAAELEAAEIERRRADIRRRTAALSA